MKICSLCKSRYDDRVDFCFRDGTPLLSAPDDEPVEDGAQADSPFSAATRPFPAHTPESSGQREEPAEEESEPTAADQPEQPKAGTTTGAFRRKRGGVGAATGRLGMGAFAPATPVPIVPDPGSSQPPEDTQASIPEPREEQPGSPSHEATPPGDALPTSEELPPPTPVSMDQVEAPTGREPQVDATGSTEQHATPEGLQDDFFGADHPPGDEDDDAVAWAPPPARSSANRGLFMALGAAAVVLLGLLAWVLAGDFGGSGAEPPTMAAKHEAPPAPPPAPVPPPAPDSLEDDPGEGLADALDEDAEPTSGDMASPEEDGAVDLDPSEGAPSGEPAGAEDRLAADQATEPVTETPVVADATPSAAQPRVTREARRTTGTSTTRTGRREVSSPEPAEAPEPWGATTTGGEPAAADTTQPGDGAATLWSSPAEVEEPSQGALTVRSNPVGAVVRVGDTSLGRTPLLKEELQPGRHSVRLEMDGYRSVSRIVNLRAGETVDLGVFELQAAEPVSGVVTIWSSTIEGAKVYVDGTLAGTIPTKLDMKAGTHEFRVVPAEGESFSVVREISFPVPGTPISLKLDRP